MNALHTLQNLYSIYWVRAYVVPAALILLAFLFSRPATRLFFWLLLRPMKKRGNALADKIRYAFGRPLEALIVIAGIYSAMRLCPNFYAEGLFWPAAIKILRSALILTAAWGLYRLEGGDGFISQPVVRKFKIEAHTAVVPFISKTLRFITVALAVLIVAQEWDFSVSGLLAGLGLGGLAFALAAQDMLSNLFGGIVILLDKPFSIGDWITTGTVEGTVEDLNFRSVKVRTFAQALVTVPNSSLVSAPVVNHSRMGKRRVSFSLSLDLRTPAERLRACTGQIRRMLTGDEEIESETVVVALENVDSGGLRLMLYFFTKTTLWKENLEIREKVYYAILDILAGHSINVALPAQSVRVEDPSTHTG